MQWGFRKWQEKGASEKPGRLAPCTRTTAMGESPAKADSVEQVFAPALVRAAQHAHDLAARVERERTRLAAQFQAGFFRQAIAFAAGAGVAEATRLSQSVWPPLERGMMWSSVSSEAGNTL